MNPRSIFTLLLATTLLGGCSFQNKLTSALSPTAPTSSSGSSESSAPSSSSSASSASIPVATGLDGTWGSNTIPGLPNITSCTNLNWSISSQSASAIAGTISAVCGGIATVTATLTGELIDNDSKVDLTAKGTVVALGLTCGFNLTGTGTRETIDSVRLNYQGSTCLGTVAGSELLRRKSQAPTPAPPSTPTPTQEPEPPPVNDPLFGCGGIQDNYQMVECIHSHIRPWDEYSSFEVTKRVAWGLRERGGAGLLIKPNGENIVSWRGYTFAAARICYPDGHIYKVLTDVGRGGANGPSWQDEGLVDRDRYLPALDPELP